MNKYGNPRSDMARRSPNPNGSAQADIDGAILYLSGRFPELSETFVYREFLGLRARGRLMIAAGIRTQRVFGGDPLLAALANEAFIVYAPATYAALPLAIARHPRLTLGALRDAATADHPALSSRAKHLVQAFMGIAAGWRLKGRRIKHVHAHMAHVPASVALYISRTLGVRFSFTGHAADLFVNRAALALKLNQAAFVACISHWHHKFYQNVAPISDARLPVIRCSAAVPATICDGRKEIVTVARLVPKKGIDLLIRAFAEAKLSDWTLRILGDGPERSTLNILAHDHGIGDHVIFEGAQPHSRCLAAIAEAGLFALPCRTAPNGDKDGIPVVLMEAMAAARAVVAGDLPAIRELITDAQSGLLVAPDDHLALAHGIIRLSNYPDLRRTLGLMARQRIIEEFSDMVNLDRLCTAFDRTGV